MRAPFENQPSDLSHWRQALWILGASTIVRLAYGAFLPLFADEAYYWEWSRRLAAGYFDHPPAIAWLIAGGTAILGDTALGVRLFPIVCGSLVGLAIARTAFHLAGPTAARFVAITFTLLPAVAAGLVLATPDAPLLAALAVTLYAVVRALDADATSREAIGYWVLAGIGSGLSMASKFTGVFVPIGVLIACVAHPTLRRQLRAPGPWIAVALAALIMVPVLRWNAQHDWIAFRFQLDHGLRASPRGSWWMRELKLIGGQLGLVTPILLGLIVAAIARALRAPREPVRFTLAVIATFSALVFIYSATRRPVEPNWPTIAWMPGLILLAALRAGARTTWERRGVLVAAVFTGVVLVHAVRPFFPIAVDRDPIARAHGWPAVAWTLERTQRWVPADSGAVVIVANRYQDAALLAWHVPGHPTVYALNVNGRRNQYDLWPSVNTVAERGATFLLVLNDTMVVAQDEIVALTPHFTALTAGPTLALKRGETVVSARRLWYLAGWSGTLPLSADSTKTAPPLPQ